MKTIFLIICLFIVQGMTYAQDSLVAAKSKVVSITPLSGKIKEVNGFAVGLGGSLMDNSSYSQKINGFNLELNPLGLVIWMFYDPSKSRDNSSPLTVNGLNISSAGYGREVTHHGLSVSLYNYSKKVSGVSVSGLMNYMDKGNGVFISMMGNNVDVLKGVSISAFNSSEKMEGLQIGGFNGADEIKGVQIGVINKSKNGKGLQIGLWNKNARRSLPIINF